MDKFLQRFGAKVIGILHGFDRLRFRGADAAFAMPKGCWGFCGKFKSC